MRILRTASEVGAMLFVVPAALGLLVARDVVEELRFQRWARRYRREHAEARIPASELRFTYAAQLGRSHGKRAASAAAATLPQPARHA